MGMIAANELRIGNWVYHVMDDSEYAGKVLFLSESKVKLKTYCSTVLITTKKPFTGLSVESIPLTPDILVKWCGFEADNRLGYLSYYRKRNGEVGKRKTFTISIGNYDDADFYFEAKLGTRMVAIIRYVHQLQNLYFSFTETELEINLP